ncbi:MAG: heme-binding protein [Salinibacterium sp.]|nr:heme-binding protein [Planctomycetota bacterium]MCB1282327.1 heme-binding protein [Salinibacterium sp.]
MPRQVTLDRAFEMIRAARAKAEEIKVPMNIAVVDAGANLVAFARMEGAWLGSIEIAQNKAFTSRAFDIVTGDLVDLCQPGAALYGLADAAQRKIVIFKGGIPLKDGDTVVGGIGVSGGHPDQDHDVAAAGAAAF